MQLKSYPCLDFVNSGSPRAHKLRDALFEVFAAEARGRRAPGRALRALEAELSASYRRPQLERKDGRYQLTWASSAPNVMSGDIVRSTVELLTSHDLGRLRLCAADDCNWVFLDHSKNGSRRWCDMNVCGNRAKARRYYARWS